MKKPLLSPLVTLIIALLVIMLAACTSPATTGTPSDCKVSSACETGTPVVKKTALPTRTPTLNPDARRTELPGIEIYFWHSYSAHSLQVIDALVEEYNRTNTDGITVRSQAWLTEDQLREAVDSAVESKELPDVLMGNSGMMHVLAENGNLADLDTYQNDPGIAIPSITAGSMAQLYLDEVSVDGSMFAIPAQREAYFLLYNTTWAAELGFNKPPETMAEMQTQLRAAFESNFTSTDKTIRGRGGWKVDLSPEVLVAWMGSGETPMDPGDMLAGPEINLALDGINKMLTGGEAWLTGSQEPPAYFTNRQALILSADSRSLPGIIKYLEVLGMTDSWRVIAYPHFSEGRLTISQGTSYAITKGDDLNQLAAWLFIQWMNAPERQARISAAAFTSPADTRAEALAVDAAVDPAIVQAIIAVNDGSAGMPGGGAWHGFRQILADGYQAAIQSGASGEVLEAILSEMQSLYEEYNQ